MKIIFLLLLLALGWSNQFMYASNSNNVLVKHLFMLSSENLNGNTSFSEDSIIALCAKVEAIARGEKDYATLFQVNQIMVNAYCLRGDIALAIDKASQMYDEVKRLNDKLGTSLALQALGNTYMYTNRYKEADETLDEAGKELKSVNNDFVKMNLIVQHLRVCAHLGQPHKMEKLLGEASLLLPKQQSVYRENYEFYILFYRLYADILKDNQTQADANFKRLLQLPVTEKTFKHLYYTISSYYYSYKGNFEKALSLSDSSMVLVDKDKDMSEFLNTIISKAQILENMGRYGEAYRLYNKVNSLNDSLDEVRYSSQLDTLHVNYWVDQLQLETASKNNRLLTWIILYSLGLLIIITAVIIIIRRKNKLLVRSRDILAHESKRAARSIQSKTLFLSNMGHEIRTPLNGIVGFSQLLATCAEIDDETKHQCEESIQQNSDLLLKLINDVMDLSNLEEREMAFTFRMHDAVNICQNVLQTVIAVKRTSAEITFTCPLEHLELYTDSERLQQVLINLLVNATKFTSEGYIRLQLDIDKKHNEAIFTVEDSGCGIPLDKQSAIFKRFEKLHENIQGSGLGLSICQLIVERFGGKIWIDPEYTEGARFMFTHPLSNQPIQRPS